MSALRRTVLLLPMLLLGACAAKQEDLTNLPPMGAFLLGHNIVVADGAEVGPLSRPATAEEWKAVMTKAIDDRLGGYKGNQWYHVAVKVEGYLLARPGIPVVLAPKSALIVTATVWDDAAGRKLNDKPKQFTVFESLSAETVFSSGLTRTKQEQMENLAANAARVIHEWMLENPDWFAARPGAAVNPAPGGLRAPRDTPPPVRPVAPAPA